MFAALGVLLLVAGAILTFAVNEQVDAVELTVIGWILMAGGGLSLLIALIQGLGRMSAAKQDTRVERHVSVDGRHAVEERQSA